MATSSSVLGVALLDEPPALLGDVEELLGGGPLGALCVLFVGLPGVSLCLALWPRPGRPLPDDDDEPGRLPREPFTEG
jgi:hypothetical protein